ncbi:MAG: hypothetical protein AAF502_20410 [Bacteroidota bacterium]
MKNIVAIPLTGVVFLTLIVFGILHWTNLPMSYFFDWLIIVASFWWLLLITTVPWNLHFKAKEVISDAKDSEDAGIEVNTKDINFAKKISKIYLGVAILLHLASAAGLYFMALKGVSIIGYVGAILALLLTALRPSVRLYEYLSYRLAQMKGRIKFPREDILYVKKELQELKTSLKELFAKLNADNPGSWLSKKEADISALRQDLRSIKLEFESLNTVSETRHTALIKQTESKISMLSEDAQFLNQVRHLLRFIKEA